MGDDRFVRLVTVSPLSADAVKAFGEAALLNKLFFEGGELAGEKVTGKIEEGESGVGDEFGGTGTNTD